MMAATEHRPLHVARRPHADTLYFESRRNRLFGWLHLPTVAARANVALVICNPFGSEAISAHRTLRTVAEAAAALGIPALRFDYGGTGNSADIDPSADQIALWSEDVVAAVRTVRRRTGAADVCVLGVRLGAMLAVLAASRCREIGSIMALAPVVDGCRYLRELHMIRAAGSSGSDANVFGKAPPPGEDPARPGALDVGGYSLSAATLETLARIDLSALETPAVREALVIDDHIVPVARAWTDSLSLRGMLVRYERVAGFVDVLMTAPHVSHVPTSLIAVVRDSLARRATLAPPTAMSAADVADAPASADTRTLDLTCVTDDPAGGIVERPVFLDEAAELFGIVTEPAHARSARRGVMLLSIGADHHIGAGRLYVELARRWARQGLLVLRFDLGGIGESITRPARSDDDLVPEEALDDIRKACKFLQTRYRIDDLTLAGVCSGAYHALRAVVAGIPAQRILLVNPENYLSPRDTAKGLEIAEIIRNPRIYRRKIFSVTAWMRVLRGEVKLWRIPVVYWRRAQLALDGFVHDLARRTGLRLRDDLARELHDLTAHGVRIVFLFARGEPGLELLRVQAGSALSSLGDRCRIHTVDLGDHTFSRLGPRLAMANLLTEELFADQA